MRLNCNHASRRERIISSRAANDGFQDVVIEMFSGFEDSNVVHLIS